MNFNHKVKSIEKPLSLLQFLSEKYTYYSLEDWKEQILTQKILVNGDKINSDFILNLNDEITFSVDNFEEPLIDDDFSIIYEDEFLFAVNKPGNLPVHPAGRYRKGNLTTLLQNSNLIRGDFFIINRLDRETSGIVLFAKSSEAASKLGKLFERGKVKKTYISYVEGFFPDAILAKGFLEKDESSKIRKKKRFSYEKKESSLWEVITSFKLIKTISGISKIFAFPETGKIHQIRATLFSIGYPIVGDKIYGNDENIFLEFIESGNINSKYGIQRQALHAHQLEFLHPYTGKEILINAFEPVDMQKIFMI